MKRLSLFAVCIAVIFTLCACSLGEALDTLVPIQDISEALGAIGEDADDSVSVAEAGDSGDDDGYESNATSVESDITYINRFLGVSFTVPGGWWIYDLNTDNLSENAGATADEMTMDISKQDGYQFMYLIDAANLQFSNKDNHIGVYITAEKEDGISTLADFIEVNNAYLTENYGNMLETSTLTVNGTPFGQSTFEIEQEEGSNYYVRVFTCAVSEGYFLSFEASYWPDNTDAEGYISQMLTDNLVLG